jgi:hypothetical protein
LNAGAGTNTLHQSKTITKKATTIRNIQCVLDVERLKRTIFNSHEISYLL